MNFPPISLCVCEIEIAFISLCSPNKHETSSQWPLIIARCSCERSEREERDWHRVPRLGRDWTSDWPFRASTWLHGWGILMRTLNTSELVFSRHSGTEGGPVESFGTKNEWQDKRTAFRRIRRSNGAIWEVTSWGTNVPASFYRPFHHDSHCAQERTRSAVHYASVGFNFTSNVHLSCWSTINNQYIYLPHTLNRIVNIVFKDNPCDTIFHYYMYLSFHHLSCM